MGSWVTAPTEVTPGSAASRAWSWSSRVTTWAVSGYSRWSSVTAKVRRFFGVQQRVTPRGPGGQRRGEGGGFFGVEARVPPGGRGGALEEGARRDGRPPGEPRLPPRRTS